MDRVCRLCGICKPIGAYRIEPKRMNVRQTACKACQAAQARNRRRDSMGRVTDVDPQMVVMVGAALRMWSAPEWANRSRALSPAIGRAA